MGQLLEGLQQFLLADTQLKLSKQLLELPLLSLKFAAKPEQRTEYNPNPLVKLNTVTVNICYAVSTSCMIFQEKGQLSQNIVYDAKTSKKSEQGLPAEKAGRSQITAVEQEPGHCHAYAKCHDQDTINVFGQGIDHIHLGCSVLLSWLSEGSLYP